MLGTLRMKKRVMEGNEKGIPKGLLCQNNKKKAVQKLRTPKTKTSWALWGRKRL